MIVYLGWCGLFCQNVVRIFSYQFLRRNSKNTKSRIDEKNPQHTQQLAQSGDDESMAHRFDLLWDWSAALMIDILYPLSSRHVVYTWYWCLLEFLVRYWRRKGLATLVNVHNCVAHQYHRVPYWCTSRLRSTSNMHETPCMIHQIKDNCLGNRNMTSNLILDHVLQSYDQFSASV